MMIAGVCLQYLGGYSLLYRCACIGEYLLQYYAGIGGYAIWYIIAVQVGTGWYEWA